METPEENEDFRIVNSERIKTIKAARQKAAEDLPKISLKLAEGDIHYGIIDPSPAQIAQLTKSLVNGNNIEAAALEFPTDQKIDREGQPPDKEKHQQFFMRSLIRALIRKRVSETMYKQDTEDPKTSTEEEKGSHKLSTMEQEKVRERQMHRYYIYEVKRADLHGHIEAPHGIFIPLATKSLLARSVKKRSEELVNIKAWHEHSNRKFVTHEEFTAETAKAAANYAIYRRPRRLADPNQQFQKGKPALRSEKKIYTKEFNLNALQAERDINAKILSETNNLSEDKKAIRPHLAIHFHKKSDAKDSSGDLIIGAKQIDGQGPFQPALGKWFQENLTKKIQKKEVKNKAGGLAIVQIAESGLYSGSPALTNLRYGDDMLGFQGFGEMLQCLQLECGQYVLNENREKMEEILQELLQEFSDKFTSKEELDKLEFSHKE